MWWLPNLPVTILSAVTATVGGLCLFKDHYGGPGYDRKKRADNLTVVITGANNGIGRQATLEFANRGAKVFMACRDLAKCEEERREIVLETGNKFVYCRKCDLASLQSVREFVARFKSEEPHCHVLVNNAGVMEPPRRVTADGFETQLGVNHLGHFLLTNLMLDTLKASAPSRVVVVSSSAHFSGKIHKEDLNLSEKFDAGAAYRQSKLANVLFARELARRTLDADIVVACVDPGLTDTDLSRHTPMMKSISRYFIYPFFWPFMKTPRIGAQTIVHAALDDDVGKHSVGDYYVDMKKAEPSKEAQDYELAMWLWLVSEKWTKLAEHQALLQKAAAA